MDFFARDYFEACRTPVFVEVDRIIRQWTSADQQTYGLMREFVTRRAKGLRPGICIAVCRALGGSLEEVTPSAAVVELFHNAFLIHDDIEDGSEERRGGPALHQSHGTPIALNVGDGLLALSLRPLLENTQLLGLSRTLQILEIVVQMVTESFEGQAIELRWIENGEWDLSDDDYEKMVRKKTCCYSFVAPAEIGAVVAKADLELRRKLSDCMNSLGMAFQIQDDLLNLADDTQVYGKERNGDLWEGKRTLMLLHALREATSVERRQALEILRSPRPQSGRLDTAAERDQFALALRQDGVIDEAAHEAIKRYIQASRVGHTVRSKTPEDVDFLLRLMKKTGAVEYGERAAARFAKEAKNQWMTLAEKLVPSIHTKFIGGLTDFVVHRRH